eukprot:jgi/Psemu1/225830/e_gw1.1676.6.1
MVASASKSKSATEASSPSPSDDTAKNGLPRILLKRNRQTKSFRDGSQLVFSGSIAREPKSLRVGDLVQVENNIPTTVVGWGLYNPGSLYRVRIVLHGLLNAHITKEIADLVDEHGIDDAESLILKTILSHNLERALSTRTALGLPSEDFTDTYRLVNGEGDALSGLAVDVVGGSVAVVMSSAAWCEIHRSTILEALGELLPDHELVWKTTPSRLKQDGYVVDEHNGNSDYNDNNNNNDDTTDEPVVCLENGIKYQTFPRREKGQKTSVYCDQRNNRYDVAELCSGKRVLDLCCYHGGFSLNAVRKGAKRAIGVDSSADAIETCRTNAGLNGFDGGGGGGGDDTYTNNSLQYVRSDIADYMRTCEETFDVVVLDPPKLAPSAKALQRASRKYHSLNRDAIKLIDETTGGLLMTCTCSAAMTQKDGGKFFLETVQQASLSARREVTLLKVSGAAPCHTQSPFSFPAGNYLTAALFFVHPTKQN